MDQVFISFTNDFQTDGALTNTPTLVQSWLGVMAMKVYPTLFITPPLEPRRLGSNWDSIVKIDAWINNGTHMNTHKNTSTMIQRYIYIKKRKHTAQNHQSSENQYERLFE